MNSVKTLWFDRRNKPDNHPNPEMSKEQTAFEAWVQKQNNNLSSGRHYVLDRNFMVPYHGAPYSEEELFGDIEDTNYYLDPKTQGAWDGWRARSEHAVSL